MNQAIHIVNSRVPVTAIRLSIALIAIVALLVNVLNIGTVHWTLVRDGASISQAESVLSGICHRMPSRSFWIAEVPLGLCSRCTGIYAALFIGLVSLIPRIVPSRQNSLIAIVILMFPMILDGLLEHFGYMNGNNVLRFVTGTAFGFGCVSLVSALALQVLKSFHPQGGNHAPIT